MSTLIPCLIFERATEALVFYTRAFGAVETLRLAEPKSGRIGHAEMTIDGARLYLSDEHPEYGIVKSTVVLQLEVDDPDAFVARAVAAGAKAAGEVRNEFHGDRVGAVVDPFGNRWVATKRIEDVTPEQMQRRFNALFV
jgi:PhnB protein